MTRTPLLCVPPAGAGASFFRLWEGHGGPLEPHALHLPGRERRFAEHPLGDLNAIVDDVLPEAIELVGEAPDVVVFGHSFGAIIAYELARRLAVSAVWPGEPRLAVSGSAAPGIHLHAPIAELPDEAFVRAVREVADYTHPAMDDPELLELILPALRADMRVHENYRPRPGALLKLPVLSVRGTDDALISAEAAAGWARVTTGSFATAELPGGHMYLIDNPEALLRALAILVADAEGAK